MKAMAILILAALPFGVYAGQEERSFRIGECYTAMWMDSRAAPAATRLGVGQTTIPLSLRTSRAKANAKERQALEFLVAELQSCQKQDQQARTAYHPLAKQTIEEFEANYRSILAKTFSGDLAWGATIEATEENARHFEHQLAELAVMVRAQHAAQSEKEEAAKALMAAQEEDRRKAALRLDFERQQQAESMRRQEETAKREQANREISSGLLLLQMARPRPAINCQSTRFFDTVNTTCN